MNISKEDIISRVLSENSSDIVKTAEELEAMLDKELSKPENEIDFGLVNQLSIAVNEAAGNKPYDIDVNQKLMEFESRKAAEKKRFRIPTWSVGLIAACLVLIFGNVYTVSAWNMNVFSFIVEFTKGGATIDFDNSINEVVIPVSDNDPYGIIAKCAEIEMTTETPHYIPDGYVLTDMQIEKNQNRKYASFLFAKDNQKISFTFESYNDGEQIGIPSDEHNISEINVNGHKAAVSKEDNQVLVVFRTGEYLVTMFTQDVNYDECEKIIESIT